MLTLELNEAREGALRNAMMIAIERYREHVKTMEGGIEAEPAKAEMYRRLADQFERQIREAEELVAMLDGEEEA